MLNDLHNLSKQKLERVFVLFLKVLNLFLTFKEYFFTWCRYFSKHDFLLYGGWGLKKSKQTAYVIHGSSFE